MIRWWQRWRNDHPASLFAASALAIAVLSIFAVALWFGLARVLADRWPRDLIEPGITQYSVIRMVLFILAGAVGVIGVVVAYRRQRTAEQGRFLEQLAEGSRLLGDPNPTVQAAGIYALAGLADAETRERRQQCVDVLCSYIRLPYAPAPDGPLDELETVTRTRTRRTRTGPVEEVHTVYRPHDRHTRETIISVIAAHLRPEASVSWSDLTLDFTGAVFDYGDFERAVFNNHVLFNRSQFLNNAITFNMATFTSIASFREAVFSGSTVTFDEATFSGAVLFDRARFLGGRVSFNFARFTNVTASFSEAKFAGSDVAFLGSQFQDSRVVYLHAEFNMGEVSFDRTEFTGGTTHFMQAQFTGGVVDLRTAVFTNTSVSFGGPIDWSEPPLVPWSNGDATPTGVSPHLWPPEVAELEQSPQGVRTHGYRHHRASRWEGSP